MVLLLFKPSALLPFEIHFVRFSWEDREIRRLSKQVVTVKLQCKNTIVGVFTWFFQLKTLNVDVDIAVDLILQMPMVE